jgi:hypothetical protein
MAFLPLLRTEPDLILYNGLELEAKMGEIFESKSKRIRTVPVSRSIDKSVLRKAEEDSNEYDPHIWFDVQMWSLVADGVAEKLAAFPLQDVRLLESPFLAAQRRDLDYLVEQLNWEGNVDPNFNSNVTISVPNNPSATLGGTLSVPAAHGVAAFTGLSLKQAGGLGE